MHAIELKTPSGIVLVAQVMEPLATEPLVVLASASPIVGELLGENRIILVSGHSQKPRPPIEQATANIADVDAALRAYDTKRAGTRWHDGRRRADVDRSIAHHRSRASSGNTRSTGSQPTGRASGAARADALARPRPARRLDPAATLAREP